MDFVAIDVETANADLCSICQVGIALFRSSRLTDVWSSFVNPEDEFDPVNVSIHGIDQDQVKDAPTWGEVFPFVNARLENMVVVCHTAFDRVAVTRACAAANMPLCDCTWLDSARVVRRTWNEFARSGYGLSNVAAYLGIQYREHDALEDARCAGEVMLRAVLHTGLEIDQWLTRVEQPITPGLPHEPARNGNPDGVLFGESIVFTGTLSIPRRDAAAMAAASGCGVEDHVTRQTTILVVGDQDLKRLNGHDKSLKHRRAEQLIAEGQPIRVLGESDFKRIVQSTKAAAHSA